MDETLTQPQQDLQRQARDAARKLLIEEDLVPTPAMIRIVALGWLVGNAAGLQWALDNPLAS